MRLGDERANYQRARRRQSLLKRSKMTRSGGQRRSRFLSDRPLLGDCVAKGPLTERFAERGSQLRR